MKLMKVENGKVTSLELLKEINFFRKQTEGKNKLRHDNLREVIKDEFEEEILSLEIQEKSISSDGGRPTKIFDLTINQSKQVLVRESKVVRKAVIKRLTELEERTEYKNLNEFERARRVSIDVKRVEQLEQIANKLFEKEKGILSTVIAELNNTSAKKMNKLLEKRSVIKKSKDGFGWYLEEDFKGRSLAEISNNGKIVRWTTKGTVFINQLYQANSIIYLEPDQMKLF